VTALGELSPGHAFQAGLDRLTEVLGGPDRRRVVILLASVLGLSAADNGAVGAVAVQLEQGLHIGNWQVGLMVTVSSLVGAVATIPVGALTDRSRRVRLLWISIAVWAAAQACGAVAPSFTFLMVTRVALGAVTATAGPTIASLTGDFFPGRERGRMYGFILTGEVAGAGVGVVLAGLAAGWFGWRAALAVLAVPAVVLSVAVRRLLPEPARGGQSRVEATREDTVVLRKIEELGVEPDEDIVIDGDAEDFGLWAAVKYVLRVRTNVILIVASSLGYFFFAGLRTFAVVFMRGRYGVGQGPATMLLAVVGLGAVAGLLVAGGKADGLIRRGRLDGRLLVGTVGYVVAAALLVPALLSPLLFVSLPLFVAAAAFVAAPNPALDAARLDVVPSRLWGRAEGVRTMMRQSLEAFAPLLFGLLSEVLGGSRAGLGAGIDVRHTTVSLAQAHGLDLTFLIMIVPLVAGGLVLLGGRRSYPVDVASAGESDRRARTLKKAQ
jgi:predicted MFS family arabinose efflux permease